MGKHCVVIGAGIIGSSCAWHLQRKGLQVTLIDHELPGQSCSFGNAACLSIAGVIPFSYPGMIRKVPAWMLDPLGPMCIRPLDFPALIPWFWRFWRNSSMQIVEAIATAQAQLMHAALTDYDEILKATDSSHLKHSKGAIHFYDSEKEYRQDQWQFDLRARLGFEAGVRGRSLRRPTLRLRTLCIALLLPADERLLDRVRRDPLRFSDCVAGRVGFRSVDGLRVERRIDSGAVGMGWIHGCPPRHQRLVHPGHGVLSFGGIASSGRGKTLADRDVAEGLERLAVWFRDNSRGPTRASGR